MRAQAATSSLRTSHTSHTHLPFLPPLSQSFFTHLVVLHDPQTLAVKGPAAGWAEGLETTTWRVVWPALLLPPEFLTVPAWRDLRSLRTGLCSWKIWQGPGAFQKPPVPAVARGAKAEKQQSASELYVFLPACLGRASWPPACRESDKRPWPTLLLLLPPPA